MATHRRWLARSDRGRANRPGLRLFALAAFGCLLASLAVPRPVEAAHPLGNFTINHYARLDFADEAVRITYVLDFAEIPTFQRMKELDPNGDGALDAAEAAAYLDAELPNLLRGLELSVGGQTLPLTIADRSAEFLPGQGDLPTLRIEARLRARLPVTWRAGGDGRFADRNFPERLGWREIVVRGGPGIGVAASTAPGGDRSDELRAYPQELLASPPELTEATFAIVPAAATAAAADPAPVPPPAAASAPANRGADRPSIAAFVRLDTTTPAVALLSLLAAVAWGASHALAPGHGKTVVAAYLVGSRGTARHAAFLGLTVTITHTIGVFALGGVTLWLSRYLLPETLYPWLNVTSGLLVIAIGAALVYQRLRGDTTHGDHDHDHEATVGPDGQWRAVTHSHGGRAHTHLPPSASGGRVTWRSLLALGVSGGLIPCPSALVLLLGAIALGRIGFGIVLVVSFSFGLALVLTAIGLLMVYARRLFNRFSFEARIPRLLPVAGALAMVVAGAGIVLGALRQAGVL